MRRNSILFLFLMLSSFAIQAQITRYLSLDFDEKNFLIKEFKQKQYIKVVDNHFILKEDTTLPALPYIGVFYLIGSDEEFVGLSVTKEELLFKEDVNLGANPQRIIIGQEVDSNTSTSDITFNDNEYPNVFVEFDGTHHIGGYKLLHFFVCPFRYIPDSKELYFNKEMKLEVKLKNVKTDFGNSSTLLGSSARRTTMNLVSNKEDIDKLYGNYFRHNNKNKSASSGINTFPYKYIIVTCDSLKDIFQQLAEWKTEKGMKAKVLTVEDIYQNYPYRNNQLKIKYALKNEYDNSNGELDYVLLGGVPSIVPAQACHAETYANSALQTSDSPSDAFYGSFFNMDWDTNGNGIYAELSDSISIISQLSVARLPIRDSYEASKIVNKIIEYEKNPDKRNWKNDILMCGVEQQWTDTIDGSPQSDAHQKNELMRQAIIDAGWTGNFFRFYDTYTDNPQGDTYDVIPENLQSEFEKGYAFANILTHGKEPWGWWSMEDSTRMYFYANARQLASPRYTMVFSDACYTNSMGTPYHNIGCSLIGGLENGIIGCYGCSDLCLGYTSTLGDGDRHISNIQKKLLNSDEYSIKIIGDIIWLNKYHDFINIFISANRWMYLYMNPFCDPGMQIYDTIPKKFENNVLPHIGPTVNFVNFGYNDFCACVMSRHDYGSSYYKVWHDFRETSFSNLTGEYLITISRQNYIPYRTIFGLTTKLQNESLSDNLNVNADHTIIGSNVAPERTQGPVTIENGYSVISSRYGTTILNDFEVKLGAELEINSNYDDYPFYF